MAKQKSYEQQVNAIIKAAKEWAVEHTHYLPASGTCHVSVETLVSDGKLEKVPVNPISASEDMNGGVEIYYNSMKNQYTYTYRSSQFYPLCNASAEE